MAGSAKVTPTPSKKAIVKTTGNGDLLGNPFPSDSPSGISPSFKPSMKSINPMMTENSPPVIIQESVTTWRNISN